MEERCSVRQSTFTTTVMAQTRLWSLEEEAILLYFVSRKICHEAVAELLRRRGYSRTPPAINAKLTVIRALHPYLSPSIRDWDPGEVNRYIDLRLGHDYVNELVKFTVEDSEIVVRVSSTDIC